MNAVMLCSINHVYMIILAIISVYSNACKNRIMIYDLILEILNLFNYVNIRFRIKISIAIIFKIILVICIKLKVRIY